MINLLIALSFICTANAADLENGRMIAAISGCKTCRTSTDGQPFAGGYPIDTPFGTFHGSNITPDPETGIGQWTFDDFQRAITRGKSPKGYRYYPAFPYTSFHAMASNDIRDLFAYLSSQTPIRAESKPHELQKGYRSRNLLKFWRAFFYRRAPATDPSAQTAGGPYLTNTLGHCGECHTPRTAFGALKRKRWLAGFQTKDMSAPNLTPSNLANWSDTELDEFLQSGMLPDGDFTGGKMVDIIEHGTSELSTEDRNAMIHYLRAIDPLPSKK